MAVTLPSVYQDGTATISANGTVVTGQGTLWTKSLQPGDFFGVHKGYAIRILSVDTDTQLTLANPWPGGAQTAAAYEIMLQSDNARMQETSRQLLQTLIGGSLMAFAALTGVAGAVPYFTGAGAMSLIQTSTVGRSLMSATDAPAARTALALGTVATQNTGTSGNAVPILNAANTWGATQIIGPASGDAQLRLNAAAGNNRVIFGQTASGNRWGLLLGTTASETGSNAGSDFSINRYSDAAAFIDSPLAISRSTGLVSLSAGLSFLGSSAATTRTNMGLGTAAVQNIGTSGATVGLLSTANTWATTQSFGAGSGNSTIFMNSGAGSANIFRGQKAGVSRWQVLVGDNNAESGSNSGSDFQIQRYDDTGTGAGTPVYISRATGIITVANGLAFGTGAAALTRTNMGLGTAAMQNIGTSGASVPLLSTANTWGSAQTITMAIPGFVMNATAAGQSRYINGQTNGANRWQLLLGDNAAEGGSNAGSNLVLVNFNDAGAPLGNPLTISRATGILTLQNGMTTPNVSLDGAAGSNRILWGRTAGSSRWALLLGTSVAESGSNAGSDFSLNRYSDSGTYIDSPVLVSRGSGAVTIRGTSTNDNATAGNVGEYVANSVTGAPFANNATTNPTSIALTAGDWDVFCACDMVPGSGITFSNLQVGVSTTSGSVPGLGMRTINNSATMSARVTGISPVVRVSLSAPATVYAYFYVSASAASGSVDAFIRARRVR